MRPVGTQPSSLYVPCVGVLVGGWPGLGVMIKPSVEKRRLRPSRWKSTLCVHSPDESFQLQNGRTPPSKASVRHQCRPPSRVQNSRWPA
jgi:hypothetical protein